MLGAINAALSGLDYNQSVVDTAANNLANSNTPGFQAQSQVATEGAGGFGVLTSGTFFNPSSGGYQQTGIGTNLAISGAGSFQVQSSGGQISTTRNGDFVEDAQGYLRAPDGSYLIGSNGKVQAPANSTLSIGPNGAITATFSNGTTQNLGTVTLAQPANPSQTGTPGTQGLGTLVSGAVEASNVDPATEMVSMMVAQSSFTANLKTIEVSDRMLKQAYQMVDKSRRSS